jgi:hypothetical protein
MDVDFCGCGQPLVLKHLHRDHRIDFLWQKLRERVAQIMPTKALERTGLNCTFINRSGAQIIRAIRCNSKRDQHGLRYAMCASKDEGG